MKQILIAGAVLVLLSGCAINPTGGQPKAKLMTQDLEPLVVGVPIKDKVNKSNLMVSEQLNLLSRDYSKETAGSYSMVKHNNEVDARQNSERTLPQAYAYMGEYEKLNKVVKKIEWDNNSANMLGRQLSDALGYKFAINRNKDLKITFRANNESLGEVLQKFKEVMDPVADVVIIEKNKTFNIVYR